MIDSQGLGWIKTLPMPRISTWETAIRSPSPSLVTSCCSVELPYKSWPVMLRFSQVTTEIINTSNPKMDVQLGSFPYALKALTQVPMSNPCQRRLKGIRFPTTWKQAATGSAKQPILALSKDLSLKVTQTKDIQKHNGEWPPQTIQTNMVNSF